MLDSELLQTGAKRFARRQGSGPSEDPRLVEILDVRYTKSQAAAFKSKRFEDNRSHR